MAYFATFLILHLYFRHHFVSTGYYIVDVAWLLLLHVALIGWAGVVAYSRSATHTVYPCTCPLTFLLLSLFAFNQATLDIPFTSPSPMGHHSWHYFRRLLVFRYRAHPNADTRLVHWQVKDIRPGSPDIQVVQAEGWVVGLG